MAVVLDVDDELYALWESDEKGATSMVRMAVEYLEQGYRPDEWPPE